MESKKVVVIHQIRESMTNLEDTIEHYRPDYLFLISPMHNITDKVTSPDWKLNVKMLEYFLYVKHIEHTKLIGIEGGMASYYYDGSIQNSWRDQATV